MIAVAAESGIAAEVLSAVDEPETIVTQKDTSQLCPAGTYSSEGFGICLECITGRFSGAPGSNKCQDCPAQYFAEGSAQRNCSACPDGMYQNSAGKGQCQHVLDTKLLHITNSFEVATDGASPQYEERRCPVGEPKIICEKNLITYPGGIWHRPRNCTTQNTIEECGNSSIVLPMNGTSPHFTDATTIYICVTEGCPDEGKSTNLQLDVAFQLWLYASRI